MSDYGIEIVWRSTNPDTLGQEARVSGLSQAQAESVIDLLPLDSIVSITGAGMRYPRNAPLPEFQIRVLEENNG